MRRRRIKRKVDAAVEEHFWDGFWDCMHCGHKGAGLTYTYAPDWYDEVAEIAHSAGHEAGCEILRHVARVEALRRAGKYYFSGGGSPPKIPARVYADAYAAARIAVAA